MQCQNFVKKWIAPDFLFELVLSHFDAALLSFYNIILGLNWYLINADNPMVKA